MRITIGGCPGSGKTTLCVKLAEAFHLTHVSAGQVFRDMASERGVSLEEFSRMAEMDESIDFEVDKRQKERAVENTVTEGRITAHLVDADVKIWLSASLEVRARRIASRENIPYEEALKKTEEREISERKRYERYYGIDAGDLSVYDVVLNTELWEAEGVFAIVKTALEVRK